MTVFEVFKSKNIEELARWIDKHEDSDTPPWNKWWDENYCSKCERVVLNESGTHYRREYGWCELNGKCKYFKYMKEIPSNKQVIKMWLESECV